MWRQQGLVPGDVEAWVSFLGKKRRPYHALRAARIRRAPDQSRPRTTAASPIVLRREPPRHGPRRCRRASPWRCGSGRSGPRPRRAPPSHQRGALPLRGQQLPPVGHPTSGALGPVLAGGWRALSAGGAADHRGSLAPRRACPCTGCRWSPACCHQTASAAPPLGPAARAATLPERGHPFAWRCTSASLRQPLGRCHQPGEPAHAPSGGRHAPD